MSIKIEINGDMSDIIPDGLILTAEISVSRTEADLKSVRETILFLHNEAAEAKGYTSAERLMNERLGSIEKAIIANKADGT